MNSENLSPCTTALPDALPMPGRSSRIFTWNRCAILLWSLVAIGIAIRVARAPHRITSYAPYLLAGEHWRHGEGLYSTWKGFVYSPLVAAFFSLFTWIGEGAGNLLWRFINGGVFLWGLGSLFSHGPFTGTDRRHRGIVFLLALPLALGNIDNAQANPLVIGLTMLAVSAACVGEWAWAAVGIALAAHLKIYPLAAGLLLCVVAPRKMPVRLGLVLLALTFLPFLFQAPDYVFAQYRSWMSTRLGDDRMTWGLQDATLDVTYLFTRVANIPVDRGAYRCIEALGGGVIAVFCAWMASRQWPLRRMVGNVFLLVSLWMLLLGPATESFTYILLAPCACLCAVKAFAGKTPSWMRALAGGGYLLLFAAVAKASLMPQCRNVYVRSMQPVGALLLLGFVLAWIRFTATGTVSGARALPK